MSQLQWGARVAALLLLSTPTLGAQAPVPVSAPAADIQYTVTFDTTTAAKRQIDVRMDMRVTGTGNVLLSLPAWTPGAYEITNFAKWVSGFGVEGDGKALAWDKLDYDTWRIVAGGAKSIAVHFSFEADSLDNAMAWTKPDFALFNGTNLFMYPEGRGFGFPATVKIQTMPNWIIATGMQKVGPNTYRESNYHDLVDMPWFVGHFDLDSLQIAGKWTRFASYPAGSVQGPARQMVWATLSKVIPVEGQVFGEVPWRDYTVMQIADPSYGGGSGLEHQSSHVDVITPFGIGNPFLNGLYSHEIFHAWNVKRMRPVDMWPYHYDSPQPTTWLWVSEGITDYYSDLALVRGGVSDSTEFFQTTAGKIAEVKSAAPVALEDASLSTWIHPTDGTGYLYYPKGSLAGLMIDILVRDASDNHHSLDDVMREVYTKDYKTGHGFSSADWWGAVSRAANGVSFADFNERYVNGRDAYPWETLLPKAGMKMVMDTVQVPRIGIATGGDSGAIHITDITPGSMAEAAGLQKGDVLVTIGDLKVVDNNFGAAYRARYTTAGEKLNIVVRRGGQLLTLPATVRVVAEANARIVADPNASAKAARIRAGILHGTVDK